MRGVEGAVKALSACLEILPNGSVDPSIRNFVDSLASGGIYNMLGIFIYERGIFMSATGLLPKSMNHGALTSVRKSFQELESAFPDIRIDYSAKSVSLGPEPEPLFPIGELKYTTAWIGKLNETR